MTVVSDEDGTRSNTWIADERGRLVGVVDAEDQRQSTSYDRWGNTVLLTERDGNTTVHEYDDRGRKVRTVTPSGADLTYGYDDHDRVTTVVTEQGAVTEYSYEGEDRNPSTILDPEGGLTQLMWHDGLLTEVDDPTGVLVRFGYDTHGDLIAVTNADGNTARMERDQLGRVTAAITPSGHLTRFNWDPTTGVLVSRHDPDGGVWTYEHTAGGRLTATVDPNGARTSIEHGPHGEAQKTADPLGRAVTRHLDELGNLAAVDLPDGTAWRFHHDALSRLTATTDPTGGTWTREYDQAGHLIATVDPTGVRCDVTADQASGSVMVGDGDAEAMTGFDPLGRVTSLAQPDGSAAMLVYDRCGRPVEALDADGGLTMIRRDAAGRPVQVTSPAGAITRYGYDRCGRLTTVTDPLGAVTTIDYDADSHPITQTLPTGEAARTTYDVCGRVVEHTQPGAGTITYRYDLAGRVVETRDPRTELRRFCYDPAGQLAAVTDGNGGITRYRYDNLGRAVEVISPLGGVTRRVFDGMNRCVAETDPLGRTTRAGYDPAGRLAWQDDPDGHRTSWTYDAAGRPVTMAVDGRTVTMLTRNLRDRTVTIDDHTVDSPSTQVLEWNRRGQLIRRARDGRAVSWTYDPDGRRTSMTTPDGHTTRYGCDPAGRLSWVEHPLLGRATFDRDPAGRVTDATAGGLSQTWEHTDGWVSAHTTTDDHGATRTFIDRDPDGRITTITRDAGDDPETTSYTYDQACQLIKARISRPTGDTITGWRYDPAGRLTAETIDDTTTEHVYDLAGQLLTTSSPDGSTAYSYDRLGRRTRKSHSTGHTRDYAWSPTGHLARITDHTGDQVRQTTLRTDGLGELASVDGTEFFWDTAEYAGAPVLAGDTPILTAGPVTGIGTEWTTPGWRTPRSTSTNPWTATAVGGDPAGTAGFDIGAAGEITIAGMEWMGARVYDPNSHGFLSVDPYDPTTGAGWAGNPYAYAGNDPLHTLDPLGLTPVTDAQLQRYRSTNSISDAFHTVNGWIGDAVNIENQFIGHNWEYFAGGYAVVAGIALMATGVGGPAGIALIAAGVDTVIQRASTGNVNWTEVAISGAAGAVGFGVGGAAAKAAGTGLRAALAGGAAGGAAEGAVNGGGGYLTRPGPHTVGGLVKQTSTGAAVGGAVGGAGGAATHGVSTYAGRTLRDVHPTPQAPSAKSGADVLAEAARAERHLSRLDHSPANDAMLDRIRSAAGNDQPLHESESNFLRHELAEADLMDGGMGYDQAHELAMRTHPTFANYHPEVIVRYPDHFNNRWREYWGMEPR